MRSPLMSHKALRVALALQFLALLTGCATGPAVRVLDHAPPPFLTRTSSGRAEVCIAPWKDLRVGQDWEARAWLALAPGVLFMSVEREDPAGGPDVPVGAMRREDPSDEYAWRNRHNLSGAIGFSQVAALLARYLRDTGVAHRLWLGDVPYVGQQALGLSNAPSSPQRAATYVVLGSLERWSTMRDEYYYGLGLLCVVPWMAGLPWGNQHTAYEFSIKMVEASSGRVILHKHYAGRSRSTLLSKMPWARLYGAKADLRRREELRLVIGKTMQEVVRDIDRAIALAEADAQR